MVRRTMRFPRHANGLCAALVGLVVAMAAVPQATQGQEAPLDRARLTEFARAHLLVNDARDEFHGKVGRIHDEQGRDRARLELATQVEDILAAHEMTRVQYDELILTISLDGAARAMFEEILVELAEEGRAPVD